MELVIRWILIAVALAVTAWMVPGIRVSGASTILLAAAVIGFINALVKPIMVLLTLPLTLLTLGLFLLVLNALLFWLAAAIVPGFEVDGFWASFLGALLMTIFGWILSRFV